MMGSHLPKVQQVYVLHVSVSFINSYNKKVFFPILMSLTIFVAKHTTEINIRISKTFNMIFILVW